MGQWVKKQHKDGLGPPKSKSIQISPCGIRWKSTVGQPLRSRCPRVRQRWSSLRFSHTVCPLLHHSNSCDLFFVNEHLLQNPFSHILKYSNCNECPECPRCKHNMVLWLQSIFAPSQYKNLRLNNVVCLHNYTSVIPVWNKINTGRFSLQVEIISWAMGDVTLSASCWLLI